MAMVLRGASKHGMTNGPTTGTLALKPKDRPNRVITDVVLEFPLATELRDRGALPSTSNKYGYELSHTRADSFGMAPTTAVDMSKLWQSPADLP
jgi:hypothetical protein